VNDFMSTTAEIDAPDVSSHRLRPWAVLATLALGVYLLFAHGCHGDEDNELFAHSRGTSIGIGMAKN
jgi:hypothetical protein